MPKKETIIIPITVYNCSNITIGIVFVSGTPNFAFNKYDFIYTTYSSTRLGLLRDFVYVLIIKIIRPKIKIVSHIHSGNYGKNFNYR